MTTKQLTYAQSSLVFFELDKVGAEEKDFKIIEIGDWIDEGKYQFCNIIFEHEGKFWSTDVRRGGSYFSEYYYDFEEGKTGLFVAEVEKVEVTVTKWQKVKD